MTNENHSLCYEFDLDIQLETTIYNYEQGNYINLS